MQTGDELACEDIVYAVDTRALWPLKVARQIPRINILQTIVEPSVEANQVNERDYADVLNFDATDRYLGQEVVSTLELYAQRLDAFPVDVFIQTSTRGEQYYDIMEMGFKHAQLERYLGVDVDANIRNGSFLRAATDHPGPSMSNRAVDRHVVDYGNGNLSYLWLSQDFETDGDDLDNDIFTARGGGPQENPVFNRAFFPDGGESIAGLPNGLQVYALFVWATDDLLTTGPNNVVRANDGAFTDPTVGNAIYCMACHQLGMNPVSSDLYDHEVAAAAAGWRTPAEVLITETVYNYDLVDAAIQADTERYLSALDALGIPIAAGPEDLNVAAAAVKDYMQPVRLAGAAAELGLTETELTRCGLEQTDNRMQSYYLRLAGPGLPRARWAFAYPQFLAQCKPNRYTVELSHLR